MWRNSDQGHKVETLAGWLKVLAEPKRLAILNLLMQGVQCNCELGDELGMATNLISHHLGILNEAGLIQAERDPLDARWIYYSIRPEKLAEINAALCDFFDPGRVESRRSSRGPRVSTCCINDVTIARS